MITNPFASLTPEQDTREKGATAVEYALLASLIAGVIFAAVGALGTEVIGLFTSALHIWP